MKSSNLKAVVLDEADEMLDLGFREDLEFILEATPAERKLWFEFLRMNPEKFTRQKPCRVNTWSTNASASFGACRAIPLR